MQDRSGTRWLGRVAGTCDRIPQHRGLGEDINLATAAPIRIERLRVALRGAVQGVGFRPTVNRLAKELHLAGWVRNSSAGLEIEVEGSAEQLDHFLHKLKADRPRAAVVTIEEVSRIAPVGSVWFEMLPSDENAPKTAAVLPDLATCRECLRELLDPADRRFGYAFTTCTLCGPRYTILLDIPYDRPNTTMRGFVLCPACRREYESPHDRRCHAQPNACPTCGPRLWSVPEQAEGASAVARAAEALARGELVALKGVGGFQLLVDACNPVAVMRLRERKHREEKPFALLMPSLALVRQYCFVSAAEEELLVSPAAPIVLLRPHEGCDLAPEVAKSSPYLGAMLPCSPLHHLLMAQYPVPVVATSGNRADEPIASENEEARERLNDIADAFVLHNRPIARSCDDSVLRVCGGRPQILRRARGYAPLPVVTPYDLPPVLAVGGHLKNTVAIALGRQVFLSQHVGDLDAVESRQAFERAIEDLCRLYRFEPQLVACDLHPDYASTQWALASGLPIVQVQHHHAHVAACAAENGIETNYLGVAWDGAGFGLDGTIWGGEFFVVSRGRFERVAHLRPFRLPGGEEAIRDCSRSAASLIWETCGADNAGRISHNIRAMLERRINAPLSSSVGRLFDAVAYLSGVATRNRFEGQAAMCLERAIGGVPSNESYEIENQNGLGDWASLMEALLSDKQADLNGTRIAAKFHNALANWIVAVARTTDVRDVVLSGGVFQNAYLTARTSVLLEEHGFRVFTHHQVPANDGGISLGQAVLAGQFES
jgi:hydrogenase maturation protein HypF